MALSQKLTAPYSNLYYEYQPESEATWQDAMNRIRQGVAQQTTARGMPVGRGSYASLVSRGVTDAAVKRAQDEQRARLAHTQTMSGLMGQPGAVQPTALSSIGSYLGKTLGEAASPVIQKGVSSGLEKLWGMGAKQAADAYGALTAGGLPSTGFVEAPFAGHEYTPAMEGGWTSPYVGPTTEAFQPAAEAAYSGLIENAPWWESTSDVANLFGGFTGW